MRRTLAVAVALGALGVTSTGCGSDPATPVLTTVIVNGEPYVTPAEASLQYRLEEGRFRLEPSWRWPGRPVKDVIDGHHMMYQLGFGTQAADWYWFCSWATEAVSPRTPQESRTADVRRLSAIRSTYYFRVALVPRSRPLLSRQLHLASLGRLQSLRRDVRLNCP